VVIAKNVLKTDETFAHVSDVAKPIGNSSISLVVVVVEEHPSPMLVNVSSQ